jgi:hypothetical protein
VWSRAWVCSVRSKTHCAGQGRDVVGLLELVGNHRADGSGESVADDVVGSEVGPGLGDEDDGDVEASGSFDEVDSGAGPVGELRELVDDDQGLAAGLFAGEGLVEDVLEEEGADFAGLVAVLGAADGDVGRPGVLVRPGAVERRAHGPGDAVVAGSDTGAFETLGSGTLWNVRWGGPSAPTGLSIVT